jgi:hypothetical protein
VAEGPGSRDTVFYFLSTLYIIYTQHFPSFCVQLAAIASGKNLGDEVDGFLVAAKEIQLINSVDEFLEMLLVGAGSQGQCDCLVNLLKVVSKGTSKGGTGTMGLTLPFSTLGW